MRILLQHLVAAKSGDAMGGNMEDKNYPVTYAIFRALQTMSTSFTTQLLTSSKRFFRKIIFHNTHTHIAKRKPSTQSSFLPSKYLPISSRKTIRTVRHPPHTHTHPLPKTLQANFVTHQKYFYILYPKQSRKIPN